MKEEFENKWIIKVPVPVSFFITRITLVLCVFVLIACKVNYKLILIYGVFLLLFIFLNSYTGIIEVHADYFRLTRFDITCKKLTRREEFHYKNISNFEFKQSSVLNFLFKFLSAFFLSGSNQIGNGNNGSSVVFNYRDGTTTYRIIRRFSYSNNDLGKAFEMIEKKVKNHVH